MARADNATTMSADSQTPKKGFFGRFRRSKNMPPTPEKGMRSQDNRDQTPSPNPLSEPRDEISPVGVEDHPVQPLARQEVKSSLDKKLESLADENEVEEPSVSPSQAETTTLKKKKKIPFRDVVELTAPPTARDAAFGGPPRYDWIDIETTAAIKLQSAFRRNQVMKQLEDEGRTTAAIRNRSRRRKARKEDTGVAGGADIPNIFACCGVGLAFGDATEENYLLSRQYDKERYEERKKEKEAKEAELRSTYRKTLKTKVKEEKVQEAYEIVD